MSEDYNQSLQEPLKQDLMAEIRRCVGLISQVEQTLDYDYFTKQAFEKHNQQMQEELAAKLSKFEFHDSLYKFEGTIRTENKKTKEVVDSAKKYMESVSEKLDKIGMDMQSFESKLTDKVGKDEVMSVWQNFERYAQFDDLKELYGKTVPVI